MATSESDKDAPFGLLIGRKAIAAYVGRTPRTIDRWITEHGFPAGKLPNGHLATDKELIRRWLLSRSPR